MSSSADHDFHRELSRLYQRDLVPLIFEPYARELGQRVAALAPRRVLETAAGTGVLTRHLARSLPPEAEIVATDLNQGMLDEATAIGAARAVAWRQADAMSLPFVDGEFDVAVCQFGAMFFPDRVAAYAETRRVLRTGGTFIAAVWDRLETNGLADVVTSALASRFPDDPPRFLPRTPYGYHDRGEIARDVSAAEFRDVRIETVALRSRAVEAMVPARGFCQGSPLRAEIEARAPGAFDDVLAEVRDAVAHRFGPTGIDAPMQALVITAVA